MTIPERARFTGTAIVGAIGTGKTNRCMCPFAEQILTYRATDKDKRICGPVLEVIGGVEEIPGFTSKFLEIAVTKHCGALGDDVSEKKPILDSRLPDGSRVAAAVPCSFRGVVLTIRKFAKHFGIEDLVRIRTLTKELADRLKTAIVNHRNILTPGSTGTVRTTSVARVKSRELDSASLGGLAFLSPRFLSLVTRPGYQHAGAQT